MDSSSSNIDKVNNFFESDIGVIKAVLDSGKSVELPATGCSMFPTLRPGDRVIVKPLTTGEIPQKGNVVVLIENSTMAQRQNGLKAREVLVMHRLVEITHDATGNLKFITRGDSLPENDKPWPQQKLLGVAVSFKRDKMEYPVKTFVPGFWRYKFNRRLLWLFNWYLWFFNKLKFHFVTKLKC